MTSLMNKKLIIIVSLEIFFSFVTCSTISSKFHKFDIVPKIITSSPKELLQVTYPGNHRVNLGTSLPPAAVSVPPTLKWSANPQRFYLLAMIDPDFPLPVPQLFHWIVGNIPGDDLAKGELLANYVSPMPPPGDDPHRYIFLIFEQPKKLSFAFNLFQFGLRFFPSLRNALKFYDINDTPLAGNFMLSGKKLL